MPIAPPGGDFAKIGHDRPYTLPPIAPPDPQIIAAALVKSDGLSTQSAMSSAPLSGLAELYHLHRTELLRFVVARTGDHSEAQDVMQELWIKIQTADSGPVAHGRAYLHRMANNLVLDRIRERRRRSSRDSRWSAAEHGVAHIEGELADQRPTAEEAMQVRQEIARLASAIASLPGGAQRAFRLHKIDGLSQAEVAERLGISTSGVEKHIAVAMRYLRRALSD